MRILATAFCCKPNSGSESAFAWWWATTTAQDHDVTVITVEAQRERIEAEMADRDDLDRLKFVYVKGPDEVSASGSSHRFERLHQYLWQLRAIPTARRLARKWRPDAAQHVSTGTWRQPSCLAFTNLNFAMGPLAGSEELPAKFARHFGMRAFLWESFRSSLIRVARIDPLVRFTLRRADIIIASGRATYVEMRRKYPGKTVSRTRAFAHPDIDPAAVEVASHRAGEPLKLVWVGRLVPTKGLDLLLEAMTDDRLSGVTVDVLGTGPGAEGHRRRAAQLGVRERVSFRGHVDQATLFSTIRSSHVFVFTSLQELMGQSLSEAMQLGAACVIYDWSGASVLAGEHGAAKVRVGVPKTAASDLADVLADIQDSGGVAELQDRALKRISELTDMDTVRRQRDELLTQLANS